jgi:uncharacterized protein (DUF849 family)
MSSTLPAGPYDGPVVVCVAPNGARRSKAEHPAVPLSAEELAAEAHRCLLAGASALHLHVRDARGQHSIDAGLYREAIAAIRERVGERLIIQVTSEAAGRYLPAQQRSMVRELRPTAVSVALREMLAGDELAEAARFYAFAREANIAVQHILYEPAELQRLLSLIRDGHISEPAAALFVFGRHVPHGTAQARDLVDWLSGWPAQWPWSLCGFGIGEPQLLTAAIGLGGHVRVGFENNLLQPDGQVAPDNAFNVANCAELARRSGRGLAGRQRAWEVLGGAGLRANPAA